ncbi:efflux RND transporter periplasmic adaptor subunit [Stieleria sp. JC731]|uniref:efflux RND transporter periplasmic adaptor subunit n=1 Tax=Pirellulaceae TaxID=2691357 RepID=UPI001E63ED57|nr:efflux RND transporter periplasmic adaptor subunit [Stieleria sp. JC731]MCC9602109.1 efflux RND transporter periplasmic adaptor subunit [Stieleria sp. JC731]
MTTFRNAKKHFARGWLALLGILIALGGLLTVGAAPKLTRKRQADEIASQALNQPPLVTVTDVELTDAFHRFSLPGSTIANQQTWLYARADGYLKDQRVDIGDDVSKGQLLAVIEAPEVKAELNAASAAVSQAEAELQRINAELELAKLRLVRERRLVQSNATSQETVDQREAEYKVSLAAKEMAVATIEAKRAEVERLDQEIEFQQIQAPFDGVITARSYDVGALITDDAPEQTPGLYRVSELKRLRVVVDVPQQYATTLAIGDTVLVRRPDSQSEEIVAKISRTTQSIAPEARTLRVEIEIPNEARTLLPGMYIETEFIVQQAPRVLIPSGALITRSQGTKVALLGDGDTVRYREVTVLRDRGSSLELSSGLTGDETLIIRPGDDLKEGTKIRAVRSKS